MKFCNICQLKLPIDAFGWNKATQDGHNAYCKPCRRDTTRARRARLQPSLEQQRLLGVAEAVMEGKRTRHEIRRSTRLSWDETMDALAQLTFVDNKLMVRRVGGEAYFFVKAA